MEDWDESFLAVEVERELEKHRAERESLSLSQTRSASSSGSGWRIFLGLIVGLTVLTTICLLIIK
jgi:hypothetical protein